MSKKIFIMGLLFLVVLIFVFPIYGAEKLYKIAVLPFDDGSIQDHWWGDYDVGKGVSDQLVTALLNVTPKRFRLIEREQIDKVLSEQELGESGKVDTKTAAKIGKILGAQFLVMGRVTEFSIKSQGGAIELKGNSFGVKSSTARVAVDARLVDTSSAEIMISVTGKGEKKQSDLNVSVDWTSFDLSSDEFQDTNLGIALRSAVDQVAKEFSAKVADGAIGQPGAISGMIAYVSGERVIINVGSKEGVKVGMIFRVQHIAEEVTDPETGEVIDTVAETVAEIKVNEVKEKSSVCAIVKKLSGNPITVKDKAEQKN